MLYRNCCVGDHGRVLFQLVLAARFGLELDVLRVYDATATKLAGFGLATKTAGAALGNVPAGRVVDVLGVARGAVRSHARHDVRQQRTKRRQTGTDNAGTEF